MLIMIGSGDYKSICINCTSDIFPLSLHWDFKCLLYGVDFVLMIQKANTAPYTKFLDPIMTVAHRYNKITLFTIKDMAFA